MKLTIKEIIAELEYCVTTSNSVSDEIQTAASSYLLESINQSDSFQTPEADDTQLFIVFFQCTTIDTPILDDVCKTLKHRLQKPISSNSLEKMFFSLITNHQKMKVSTKVIIIQLIQNLNDSQKITLFQNAVNRYDDRSLSTLKSILNYHLENITDKISTQEVLKIHNIIRALKAYVKAPRYAIPKNIQTAAVTFLIAYLQQEDTFQNVEDNDFKLFQAFFQTQSIDTHVKNSVYRALITRINTPGSLEDSMLEKIFSRLLISCLNGELDRQFVKDLIFAISDSTAFSIFEKIFEQHKNAKKKAIETCLIEKRKLFEEIEQFQSSSMPEKDERETDFLNEDCSNKKTPDKESATEIKSDFFTLFDSDKVAMAGGSTIFEHNLPGDNNNILSFEDQLIALENNALTSTNERSEKKYQRNNLAVKSGTKKIKFYAFSPDQDDFSSARKSKRRKLNSFTLFGYKQDSEMDVSAANVALSRVPDYIHIPSNTESIQNSQPDNVAQCQEKSDYNLTSETNELFGAEREFFYDSVVLSQQPIEDDANLSTNSSVPSSTRMTNFYGQPNTSSKAKGTIEPTRIHSNNDWQKFLNHCLFNYSDDNKSFDCKPKDDSSSLATTNDAVSQKSYSKK